MSAFNALAFSDAFYSEIPWNIITSGNWAQSQTATGSNWTETQSTASGNWAQGNTATSAGYGSGLSVVSGDWDEAI